MTENVFREIASTLESSNPPFVLEWDKAFQGAACRLFATRRAGMGGTDYVFFHDADTYGQAREKLASLHEAARAYANSFYKMPKSFRFKCPNIISVFVYSGDVSADIAAWMQEPTRSIVGGEHHFLFCLCLQSQAMYGQGKGRFEGRAGIASAILDYRKIDPQSRAYHLMQAVADALYGV
jgi:hypothetical protein